MSGGGSDDPNVFNEEVFNFRRIRLAPTTVLIGFGITIYAILKNPKNEFIDFVRFISNNPKVNYSERIAESEKSVGYRNFAMCYYLKSLGNIE